MFQRKQLLSLPQSILPYILQLKLSVFLYDLVYVERLPALNKTINCLNQTLRSHCVQLQLLPGQTQFALVLVPDNVDYLVKPTHLQQRTVLIQLETISPVAGLLHERLARVD